MNYNPKKAQAPFTQYGPYTNVSMAPDMLSANGASDIDKFEVMSAGAYPLYKSPQTMQEFQYSNNNQIDESMSDNYGSRGVPNYHRMKDKLNSMRKQNASNVASNILNNNSINKPTKAQMLRTKSVDNGKSNSSKKLRNIDDEIDAASTHNQVIII